jgi:hypothetical protein
MLTLAVLSVVASLTVSEQHVSVRAYGCDFSNATGVDVVAENKRLFAMGIREVKVPVSVSRDGSLLFKFELPPGAFDISYNTVGSKCASGGEGLVVLAGRDRHVTTSMVPYEGIGVVRDWHNREFFAGTVPPGVSVSVVQSTSSDCPDETARQFAAAIDDGAYYVGYVYGPHNFLEIRSWGFDVLDLAMPDPTPVGSHDELVIRNISVDDLRSLAAHKINENRRCIKTPTGVASPFQ